MEGKKRSESKIPVSSPAPLRRTGSLRLGTCTPIQEHQSVKKYAQAPLNRRHSLQSLNTASSFSNQRDDDVDSVDSFSSTASVCSNMSQCDHAHFARNGTTYSGRCKRYVVHCSPHSAETDDYLTPTQRTNRTIRRLRSLLKDAQADLIDKDKEILRLTKEVVELRLLKVDSSTDSNNGSSGTQAQEDTVTDCPARNLPSTSSPRPRSCSTPPLAPSLSDSGHFEELNSSKETSSTIQSHINQIKTIESLQRQYEDEIRELKEMHNDKVDSLLQRITDVNDRYYALRPLYEDSKEKINALEKVNEELTKNLSLVLNEKITGLEIINAEMLQEKQSLTVELNDLKTKIEVMEVDKFNYDELLLENNELKNKQNELMAIINTEQENKCKSCSHISSVIVDDNVQSVNISNGVKEEAQSFNNCEHDNHCSYKLENSELRMQIVAHIEKLKVLEDQLHNDKLTQLCEKEVGDKHEDVKENPATPDLLQKLKIKQEELDNVKDKDYISPDNLLSAKEAISLWKLTHKAMYRRLLASRKDQPKHDPEMTLQFLKSAFYYFLTDRENAPGHLSAIESILGFTDNEKLNIEKAFLWR